MEKPREKLLHIGDPKKLETEDLLSILLGHGSVNINVFDLSIQIAEFLRLKSPDTVTINDLKQFNGIGEVKAMQILSALELGRRYHHQEIKGRLSDMDWDFAELTQGDRQYGVHFFHHYTAKFIPQIPSRIIRKFAKTNSVVVDPFMGSGTTLVEAKLLGCHSYGLDTNPMAIKIARAKTLKITDSKVKEINGFLKWLDNIQKSPDLYIGDQSIELFKGSNLWFRSDVSNMVSLVLNELKNYSPDVKNFLEVGLSTLLKGISNARMDSVTPVLPNQPIYTDRKHYYREVNNLTRIIPVYRRLNSQIRRMKDAILDFNRETDDKLVCNPIFGDARQLSNYIKHCDLVITSPPYWSAQNYENIHMLSMAVFNLETGIGKEIGRDVNGYLDDMKTVFSEIANILHGHFAIVIGHDDTKRTHEKLFQMINSMGFIPVDSITRRISNQVSRAKQINNEYIYIFRI